MAKPKKKTPVGKQTRPGERVVPKPAKKAPSKPIKGNTRVRGGMSNASRTIADPVAATAQAPTTTTATTNTENTEAVENPSRAEIARRVQMAGLPATMVNQIMSAWGDRIDADSEIEDYIALGVENAEFRARYPSIVNQWDRLQAGEMGVQLMSPNEVIAYEKALLNAADDYGLSSWVSSPEQVAKLINSDVSADEAIDRINMAGYAAALAPDEYRAAFFKHYGLTEGNLVGYFLDPDKEEAEIKKAVAQGTVVASAMKHGFANDWRIGERLVDRGVNEQSAASGFARAALLRGIGSGLGQTISEDTMIDAEFGDATAAREVASVTAQHVGRFNTAGGAAESQKGVSGLSRARST